MAYYGGEDQRKKDEKKKKIDSFMDKAMPKRTFDQMGRETNRRTGEVLEEKKPKPLGKMVSKAYDLDFRASKEKDINKKQKLEDRARMIQMNAYEQLDGLLTDPLAELWDLYEEVMPKPDLGMPEPSSYAGPNRGKEKHPVTQQKDDINVKIKQGAKPEDAHQEVYGEVDTSDVQSKGKLAATLGRIQDDGLVSGVKLEPDKGSILSRDAKVEAELDQVTDDDLKTPMNQQVPDRNQPPQDQVAEETEMDYNEDVAFLQKYGRA